METEREGERMEVVSRRGLLAAGGAALAAASGAAFQGAPAPAPETRAEKRMVMVIDLRRCYGCQACSVACKSEHDVPLGNFRCWVTPVTKGSFPGVRRHYLPRQCNHCERPACVKVCPLGASFRRIDGVVLINKETCIGCRYCMGACPYRVRAFGWKNTQPEGLPYPSRIVGVPDKCDLCVHRLDQGLVPACVNTCPAEARSVGDLNDPGSRVAALIASNPVQTLRPDLGTAPQVYYIGLDQDAAEAAVAVGVRMKPVELTAGGGQ